MNQARLSLPVKLLYTALQFLINFYYFSKADIKHQFFLFKNPNWEHGWGRCQQMEQCDRGAILRRFCPKTLTRVGWVEERNPTYRGALLGNALPIGVNLSLGEWNSRLHKQSPPARTKRKLIFLTRAGGFRLCRRGF
ncbi:hypothetical protein LC605_16560 [Nostoc sp. CHAB 5836]|uniref:hypothetical protein n=1 Tax=Nostoc sp. CHAB 5836 TaxID=2780404 RepID=UPI001E29D69C|nr:hypothetical protein [Nostoc sp. CHAB 5836]MCC5616653.1 hypothetical protein [Nostoc sp. CHAB 5836]